MPKRTVTGVDVFAWTTLIEGTNPPLREYHHAVRGDVIDVPDDVADRGDRDGHLSDADATVVDPFGVTSSAAPMEEVARAAGILTQDGRATASPGTLNPRREVLVDVAAAGAGAVTTTSSGATVPASGGTATTGAVLADDVADILPEGSSAAETRTFGGAAELGGSHVPGIPSSTPPDGSTGTPEATTSGATSSTSDDELRTMNAEAVIAHLNQYPGDVERVAALEGERSSPRVTVDRAIEAHRSAGS